MSFVSRYILLFHILVRLVELNFHATDVQCYLLCLKTGLSENINDYFFGRRLLIYDWKSYYSKYELETDRTNPPKAQYILFNAR